MHISGASGILIERQLRSLSLRAGRHEVHYGAASRIDHSYLISSMLLLSLIPLCSGRLIFTTGLFFAEPGFQHAGADAVELVLGGDGAQCIALLLVFQPMVAVQHRLRGVEFENLLRCTSA